MTTHRWGDIAHRAGLAVGASGDAADDAFSLTVVLQVPGAMPGAIHAFRDAPPTTLEAQQFAEALETECMKAGLSVHVLWKAVSRGPHAGIRQGAVVIDVQTSSATAELGGLNWGQTLDEARTLTRVSVEAIGDEIRGMHDLARAQADGLQRVASQFADVAGAQGHGTIGGTVEQLSARLRTFGEDILDRTSRQARDIDQARAWTNDIVKLGQAIAAIASNARILTFNARLESARIGEAGRGFAVIAGSIQELATQVRQTNQAVAKLAENLSQALPRLGADAQDTAGVAKTAVCELEQQLLEVHARIDGARADSWEALSDSSALAQKLEGKANAVLGHLQFGDKAQALLLEAAQQAQAVLGDAGSVTGVEEAPTLQ